MRRKRTDGEDTMMQRDKVFRLILLGSLIAAVPLYVWLKSIPHNHFDLRVYQGAVEHWLRGGGELYDFRLWGFRYGFTYPPFAAMLMAPMAFLPFPVVLWLNSAGIVVATVLVVWIVFGPVIDRYGRPRWYTTAVVLLIVALYHPLRETYDFGQINMYLLALVAVDLLVLLARGSRFAGVGIGLAMAIKLTPGIFLIYLLITRRWRAAAVASGTAALVTIGAAIIAPDESTMFWFSELWDTSRVGDLYNVSNQSLQGFVARLSPSHPNRIGWVLLALVVLAFWAWRTAGGRRDDLVQGFAVTGVVGCLVSPVTWVHHLVWLLPAFLVLADRALAAPPSRWRAFLLVFGISAYGVMISRVVWLWKGHPERPFALIGSNMFLWVSLALLVVLLVKVPTAPLARLPRQRAAAEPPAADAAQTRGRAERSAAAEPGGCGAAAEVVEGASVAS